MLITDDPLDAAAAKASFSGVVTIDAGDRREVERCYGFAHRALEAPNTAGTRFAVASGGKTFTALAVLRLAEQGLLRLGDPVRPLLGADLPLIDDAVTIEHLLTHTSGIGDYLDEEAEWDAADYVLPMPVHTLAETEAFVPVLDGYPQAFAPGERFAYCNGGYVVLALLAERVSGRGFHELVEREVCDRAGLSATRFLRSDELPGDGGIYTTAGDLHAFWQALTDGRIVAEATVAAMALPRFDVPAERKRYGLGLWLHRTGPALIVEGYDAGVSFRSTHEPRTRTTVTVIGNTSEGAWPVIAAVAAFFD